MRILPALAVTDPTGVHKMAHVMSHPAICILDPVSPPAVVKAGVDFWRPKHSPGMCVICFDALT